MNSENITKYLDAREQDFNDTFIQFGMSDEQRKLGLIKAREKQQRRIDIAFTNGVDVGALLPYIVKMVDIIKQGRWYYLVGTDGKLYDADIVLGRIAA